jgi:hypothetical protein
MRILLDECMPRSFKNDLPGHEIITVREIGWASVDNGDLLRLAETAFDVFLTVDQSLQYQQNLSGYQIAVIVMVTKDIRLVALRPLAPLVLDALRIVQVGDLVRIEGS